MFPPKGKGEWRKLDRAGRKEWLDDASRYRLRPGRPRVERAPPPGPEEPLPEFVIDGADFEDLEGFLCAMGEAVNGPGGYFGSEVTSFDDCLFGGFGLEAPCTIRWRNTALSRARLGPEALIEVHQGGIDWIDEQSDPSLWSQGKEGMLDAITRAREGQGSLFEEICAYIESSNRRARGRPEPGIVLVLE